MYRPRYPTQPSLSEVCQVARATVAALNKLGLKSCLVGGLACSAYGNTRTPSDVDIVALTDQMPQEEIKRRLVETDSNFYLIRSKDPFATYRVLWYQLSLTVRCKVDILLPGIMNIPSVPDKRIVYTSGSKLPVMPFLPLLFLKLQAWMDHRNAAKYYLILKQHTDVRDIDHLLNIARKHEITLSGRTSWLPESFVLAARSRVKEYVRMFPDTAKRWEKMGFSVP